MLRLPPLYDYAGTAQFWLTREDWFIDEHGSALAYLNGHRILTVVGRQAAWWDMLTVLSLDGYTLLVTSAGNTLGSDTMPRRSVLAPIPKLLPPPPPLRDHPIRPYPKGHWASAAALLARLQAERMVGSVSSI